RATRARAAARPAARGARARVLRRLHAVGARRPARAADRHDQEQDVHRFIAAAGDPGRSRGGCMDSLSVHDLTAAYALVALDPDEAREYEAHLATCKECQEELARLGSAAGALAFAVESPAPPPDLRQRILDAAVGERENVVPLRPRWAPAAKIAVAAAACLAVGFGVWAATLSRSLDRERSARERADQALAIISDPTATRTSLT